MQHVSIMLAFCAVFGLAVYRALTPVPDASPVQLAGQRDASEERHINDRVLFGQINQLSKRIVVLEGQLHELKTLNASLTQKMAQLSLAPPLTTASIRPATGGVTTVRPTSSGLPRIPLRGTS